MSKKRNLAHIPAAKVPLPVQAPGQRWSTADSFANFEARVGIGTNNQSAAAGYQFDFISRNRVQLEAMYRSSWIVGKAVDVVAEDMTRNWIDIKGTTTPSDIETLSKAMMRMRMKDQVCDMIKWSRLYGGAIGVMLIDGQKMDTPLRPETVAKGAFKGMMVLDRWLVQPTLNELVSEFGPSLGMPKFYEVIADSLALKRQRIHYSRVVRLDGVDLPYWQRVSENLWGQSVIERLFDRLIAYDSTTQGVAQLVYKAHLRTYKVEGLREIIAIGGAAMDGLAKQIAMITRFQSNEGMTVMDVKDEFETHAYTFTGLDDVLLQFGQQLAGALDIPLVRLFGQAPRGMNATGEADMQMYENKILQDQERRLRSPLTVMLEVLCYSELGKEPEQGFGFEFAPLSQMSSVEKADVAQKTTQTVLEALDVGAISMQLALTELRQISEQTGLFTNITDAMIADADDKPPEINEMEEPNAFGPDAAQTEVKANQQSGAGAKGTDAIRRIA